MSAGGRPKDEFFAALDEGTRGQLMRVSRRLCRNAGEVIVDEGAEGVEAFVLLRGRCEVSTGGAVVTYIGPNELFGELGALGVGLRTATVRAVEPCELLAITGEALQGAIVHSPALLGLLLRSVVERTRGIAARETLARSEHLELKARQQSLVPSPRVFQDSGCLGLEVCWQPLTYASGDYCDVVPLGDRRYLVAVGDVVGHGAQAALTLATMRGHLRALSREYGAPASMLRQLDCHLSNHGPENTPVTLVVAFVDASEMRLRYAIAGHPRPLWYREGRVQAFDAAHGPLLGYGFGADFEYIDGELDLAAGDRMLFYTDGLSEARQGPDVSSDVLGPSGLAEIFRDVCRNCKADLLTPLFTAVDGFRRGYPRQDDVTAMLIQVQ